MYYINTTICIRDSNILVLRYVLPVCKIQDDHTKACNAKYIIYNIVT